MKIHTIVTPANIEVEYRLANAGSRLAALIIDMSLQLIAQVAVAAVVLFGFANLRMSTLGDTGSGELAFVMIAAFVIQFGYFIACEMLMNGQSVGKRVFKLRVIRDNGLPIEFGQSLVRNLLRPAVDMLYIGLFVILFSKHHKRLGDMAAGTIVVSEHLEPDPPDTHLPQVDLGGLVPEGRTLTEAEQLLVNEWLKRRDALPDGGEAIRLQLYKHFNPI